MAPEPNYFTCTLGQAQSLGLTQSHKTVNAFIDAQARENPDLPAVGFAVPQKDQPWQYRVFTFLEIRNGSCNLANNILSKHPELKSGKRTVGLLCPSTPEFLFLWLALMRAGCAVLLIAPQCQAPAIKALFEQCESTLLFHHEMYAEQAQEAAQLAEGHTGIQVEGLPLRDGGELEMLISQPLEAVYQPIPPIALSDVAYLHHTSGTSSGLPKPVPQPHNAAVGVLSYFPDEASAATFTTTPLFHGGIADLFRAWTSSALVWLFPGNSVPITSTNILKCLDVARRAANERNNVAPVKYFSSVPYVLQMLDAEAAGVEALRAMDMAGVGGAALPAEVGDRLVSKGVNLISRYGSAECGFLMSSQRDFSCDGEWRYLRYPADVKYLRLEKQEDSELRELIVLHGWPHMAKRNRDDGSYATSDLFAPHDSIPGAWKYHSRSDSQLTLITGKKFDPAPLEDAIATSDLLEDVLVFGNGQPYPGALLFRSAKARNITDMELLGSIWPTVDRLNRDSPDHARIARNMLRPMPQPSQPLEKSSKGTMMRGVVQERFETDIKAAYQEDESATEGIPDEDVQKAVHEIVEHTVPRKRRPSVSMDLFSFGVDSVAGMQIRSKLQRLLPADAPKLPMTVVEDCGTVSNLAKYIVKKRHGEKDDKDAGEANDHARMWELVDEYSSFHGSVAGAQLNRNASVNGATGKEVVVLTGATGALGAHVLNQYRQKQSVRKIYCLIRGADHHAARERVQKALTQRKLPSLGATPNTGPEVIVLPSQLSDPLLGLEEETYDQIASEATIVLHVAWSVNFRMRLHSFVKDNIGGATNMINLALASPSATLPAFGFCSSVAAVAAYDKGQNGSIREAIISDPSAATQIGYSQSKWVAEQICARAAKQTGLRDRMTVFRVGQLAGDREHGVWNASEAWPLMLTSALETKCLPDLGEEVLNWLPVDLAAQALIEGMEARRSAGEALQMLHILNPHDQPIWSDLLAWFKSEGFSAVKPADWVVELEKLGERQPEHPALKLVEHWRRAYGGHNDEGEKRADGEKPVEKAGYAVEQTRELVPAMRQVQPVDREYFAKLWQWIRNDM